MNVLDGKTKRGERARLWRLPDPGAPELLHAAYRTRTFSRHAHDRLAIGVIEAGGLAFRYRGQDILAPAGWVNLSYPGEVHSGQPAGPEGWAYRMFYLDPAYLAEIARSLDPTAREMPFVPAGAVWDPELALRVARLHALGADAASDPLARQSLMGELVSHLILRHSQLRPDPPRRQARQEVARAKALIEEAADTPLQLQDLAACAAMNPFTLVRCFTAEMGLPPHAYLVQVRVTRAAELLRQGKSPAAAAAAAGFSDQSHLNRHFLKHFGVTPGVYQRAFFPGSRS